MKKKPISVKLKKPKTENYRVTEEFLSLHTMKTTPVSIHFLEHLAEKVVDYALNDENALLLTFFYAKQGINGMTIKRWLKKSKKLAEAHKTAKELIAARRELGALTRKLDANTMLRSMPLYSKEWKDLEEWRASLRNQEHEEKVTTFKINLPNIGETDDKRDSKTGKRGNSSRKSSTKKAKVVPEKVPKQSS